MHGLLLSSQLLGQGSKVRETPSPPQITLLNLSDPHCVYLVLNGGPNTNLKVFCEYFFFYVYLFLRESETANEGVAESGGQRI